MKLIIDISEEDYENIKNDNGFAVSRLAKYIKNGIPLAGIMAEISHKIKLCSDKKMSYGMEVALAIIDKYTKGVEE